MLKSIWWFLLFLTMFMVTSTIAQSDDDRMSTIFFDSTDETPLNDAPGAEVGDAPQNITETELEQLLKHYDAMSMNVCNRAVIASWNVATDVGNKTKEEIKIKAVAERAKFVKDWYNSHWKYANEADYKDESIRRQLRFHKNLGEAILNETDLNMLTNIITQMSNVYNSATVCPYNKQNCDTTERLTLDPDIQTRLGKSRDVDELKYLWVQWRDATGRKIRDKYEDYVELMNKVGTGNGFKDAAEYWKNEFEDPQFEEHLDDLWKQVEPLYLELHTYMRYKLWTIYGDKFDCTSENIPAHLLGNMWAQSWEYLFEETKPFANGSSNDVTAKLQALKYNARKMFEISNEFYMSLGLPTNEMSYTGESIIEKPTNRTIQCHASAWDFCDGKDFRIKMCTNINQEDLITIHHEMGHIQYYIQYKDQPSVFRKGANPGFHEAVGDTMALSVANPKHLVKIGLLNNYTKSIENNINALYMEALQRVAFLPFGFLIDKWRWDVFSKKVSSDSWNSHWWTLREKYQKISSPVPRTEDDFDPGAKFHVPANSKYISYFISHLLEFSFYKALCSAAGEYNSNNVNVPLHQCDFYQSKEAGRKIADALKLGASKHWSEALKLITGETTLSANAILEYFKPLRTVLVSEINRMKALNVTCQYEEDNVVARFTMGTIFTGLVIFVLVALICTIVYGIYKYNARVTNYV
ncbi:angiotensin-converting enzyme-like isoform X2 [Contarinia nasturtii]|uniref:angiotensin-converting enzyme-like isoform X2 n=1 Tax=Contarinia nasturtii TaxID=265458 RepID=UPI0012D3EFEA|nr:angiotensin-converting enzyme-like isoform X2 [Contarinia nasturtii]